jgi:hypothetical protein
MILKRYLLLILISIFIESCSINYVQLIETKSTNIKAANKQFVFENDTLKITYTFWAPNGVMSFSIYNKLNIPIYIDWKKSAMIYNSDKMNYWLGENQNIINYEKYENFLYKGVLVTPDMEPNKDITHIINEDNILRSPERMTFIPPKSYIYKSQFSLYTGDYFKFEKENFKRDTMVRNDRPKKKTIVKILHFDFSDSPVKFRNYIGYSMSEDSKGAKFIDNEFYVSIIKQMDRRHFTGKILKFDKTNSPIYTFPFRNSTSFFLEILPY